MTTTTKAIRCILFDCDGVLVDSERLCCRALVEVFAEFDVVLNPEECMMHFRGGKMVDILSETMDRHGLKIALDDLEPRYRQKVKALFAAELKPVDGVKAMIAQLEDRGIEYCVVSNNPTDKIVLSLQSTDLYKNFEGRIFSAFEANSWKPDPDLLLYAAMNMGFSPAECLYVDDTENGIAAGINAGIETVHFRTSPYSAPCAQAHVLEIEYIDQLLPLLDS